MKKKWLVVVKYYYYPSVFEFDDEAEAISYYKKLVDEVNDMDSLDYRVYMTEVQQFIGGMTENVEW